MKEIIIYGVIALSSLVTFAYTVHMFIGGLVSDQAERIIMAALTTIWAVVIGLLARDVVKRRRLARYGATGTSDNQ
ncbi:MAG: hypothetical protein FD165_2560 [Gammaproteobacteria bacterium]|nr:MAG: hypothetical protein FD165_2560 [Gammaproteobacteria bacterium]TND02963.1 MAG: hypothetical protein FD120_2032 [Gammaproteobacteria bacterium]